MDRRTFLQCAGGAATAGLTGCLGVFDSGGPTPPPVVEDRPAAVYYPSHVEGMQLGGMGSVGPYRVAVTYSFPHRFWLITGRNRKLVEIRERDSVHLMATVWDPETGMVIPASSVSFDVTLDGESVTGKRLWPMLSQNMGFHYGDNVTLAGDGTYQVDVAVDPVGARRTGAFADRFGTTASATVAVEYSQADLEEVMYRPLEERKGQRGAVSPMQMEMLPVSQLPTSGDLPGTAVGEASSGDATFVVRAVDAVPAGLDGSGTYLAVSPRTPYNRYPLPMMSLSATLSRDGTAVYDGQLHAALDPGFGYHYGAVVDSLSPGDALELSVGAPPQVARHEGYETAFLEMDATSLVV